MPSTECSPNSPCAVFCRYCPCKTYFGGTLLGGVGGSGGGCGFKFAGGYGFADVSALRGPFVEFASSSDFPIRIFILLSVFISGFCSIPRRRRRWRWRPIARRFGILSD